MTIPCRDATRVRALLTLPLIREGDGAPKSAKSYWHVSSERHAGASRRATCASPSERNAHAICGDLTTPGRAFAWDRSWSSHCRAQVGRRPVAQQTSHQLAPSRDSLVVPGGAPAPPECSICEIEPAGAAPRPASRRLMMRPSSGRGGCRIEEVWDAGISFHTSPSRGGPASRLR
jgi:hypothetical protein